MAKIIELWPHQAVNKALDALSEFQKTGSREGFKKWRDEYGEKIEKDKKIIIDILTGEKPVPRYTPIDDMKKDALLMDFEEWDEKHGDELWIMYHEEGVNYDYDVNYEDWCENKYDEYNKLMRKKNR